MKMTSVVRALGVKEGVVELVHIDTKNQLADMLTISRVVTWGSVVSRH